MSSDSQTNAQVTAALQESDAMVKDGRLDDAVASLMPLEKQTRLATDVKSSARILFSIVRSVVFFCVLFPLQLLMDLCVPFVFKT